MRSPRGTRPRKHRVRCSPGTSGVPAIPNAGTYTYASPNRGAAALQERAAAQTMASNPATGRPHLAFVNSTSARSDRDARSRGAGDVVHADGRLSEQRLRRWRCGPSRARSCAASARACSGCRPAATTRTRGQGGGGGGAYANLMGTLGDGLWAFYSDMRNQGLADDTTVIVFSEFGRRISENGSAGTDHGAAGLMMVLGGIGARRAVRHAPHRSRLVIRRWRTTPATFATRPTSDPCTRDCSTSGWV